MGEKRPGTFAESPLGKTLAALWNKTPRDTLIANLGTQPPGCFLLHRFLASEPDFAIAARYLQADIRGEEAILFATWQGLLPRAASAPFLKYVAPKKGPEAEELTLVMMGHMKERREIVEELQEIFALQDLTQELYQHYGVEPPKK